MACDISPVASRQDASGGAEQQCGDDSLQRKTCNSRMTYQLVHDLPPVLHCIVKSKVIYIRIRLYSHVTVESVGNLM